MISGSSLRMSIIILIAHMSLIGILLEIIQMKVIIKKAEVGSLCESILGRNILTVLHAIDRIPFQMTVIIRRAGV
jgi:hypothetical protein